MDPSGLTSLRALEAPPLARTSDLLIGQIVRVSSSAEGHLVLELHTEEGDVELRGSAWLRVFDAELAVPTGDLWSCIGSEAFVTYGLDGETLVMDSIAVR